MLMQSNIFSFIACAFGVIYKKSFPNPMSLTFSLIFSAKSFIILALMFRSLLHFELNFAYVMRERTNFIRVRIQNCHSTICWSVLSPLNGLGTLVENHLTIYVRIYFWAIYSIPQIYISAFALLQYFVYYRFAISFKTRKCEISDFVLFEKGAQAIQSPLKFHMNLKTDFSISLKTSLGFDRYFIEFVDHFRQYQYLNNIELYNP